MPTSIAVSSGKGGVGKTSVAVNLALTLQQLGKRVAIFDADFGMANSHILLGVNPSSSLSDVLSGEQSINDIICTGPKGVRIVSGGSGLLEMLNVDPKGRYQTIRMMDHLKDEIDVLIVDVPAGASDNSVSFVAASDRAVVVLVGEPTSFLDAYSFIKACHLETGLVNFTIAVNMAGSEVEAKKYFDKFNAIVMQFLDVKLRYGGYVPFSQRIRKSIVDRKPIALQQSGLPEVSAFKSLAKNVLASPQNISGGIRFFDDGTKGGG